MHIQFEPGLVTMHRKMSVSMELRKAVDKIVIVKTARTDRMSDTNDSCDEQALCDVSSGIRL